MSSQPGDVGPLAIWMREKRVTPIEMAERCGVSASNVRLWVQGRHQPSKRMLAVIERVTLEIEIELKIAVEHQRGVRVLDWFPDAASASAPSQAVG